MRRLGLLQNHLLPSLSVKSTLSPTPTTAYNPDINHPASLHHDQKCGAGAHPGSSHPSKKSVKVVVTGAAGNIGYSIVFMIGQGLLLGSDQPIELRLLDIPAMEKSLRGLVLELEDCAYPLLTNVVATSDYKTAFENIDIALLIGAKPRGPGMQRSDLLRDNAKIFSGQGKALDQWASRNVKVLVVGNPANTNALIALKNAPSLNPKNFTALTHLDQSRAKSAIAIKAGVHICQVKNVIIWGNHSKTQYPDVNHGYITSDKDNIKIRKKVNDCKWIDSGFITGVQERGAVVIEARQKSSAGSAAQAVCDHIRAWWNGSQGEYVSMGVYSDGSHYGIPKDLIFSFPVITKDGGYSVVDGLTINEFSRKKLQETTAELLEERKLALGF